jgi:hypothetical protein
METGRPFSDYKFTTAETLVDENAYSPYFLALQKDGTVGLVVLTTLPSTLNQNASLAIFADYRTGVYGEDETDVAYVTYIVDGEVAAEALPVDLTEFAEITALDPYAVGATFLFAKNGDGIVDQLELVFVPGTGAMADVVDDPMVPGEDKDLDEFMVWNTADEEDNEIFFGTLLKAADGKLTVAPYQNTTATISGSSVEIVNVANTAKVYAYKGYNTDAKKLAICDSVVDLDASSVRNSTGDYTVDAATDLAYVFFRINNGTVVEVIGVDYYKD